MLSLIYKSATRFCSFTSISFIQNSHIRIKIFWATVFKPFSSVAKQPDYKVPSYGKSLHVLISARTSVWEAKNSALARVFVSLQ